MIYIGTKHSDKEAIIRSCVNSNSINFVVIIVPERYRQTFNLSVEVQYVDYANAINYNVFYPLLERINNKTLIVLNECLRTQNRYDLTYNCIRHYLNQTPHQIIFNQLPQINKPNDFMILFDWDTQSKWKREKFSLPLIKRNARIEVAHTSIEFERIAVLTSEKTKKAYAKKKATMFANIGKSDPHILPRRLYMLSKNDKKAHVANQNMPLFRADSSVRYIARNKRLGLDSVVTYHDVDMQGEFVIVDLPHRFIDFADFMRVAWQYKHKVLCADLKVDQWYFERYNEWRKSVNETCASLQ